MLPVGVDHRLNLGNPLTHNDETFSIDRPDGPGRQALLPLEHCLRHTPSGR